MITTASVSLFDCAMLVLTANVWSLEFGTFYMTSDGQEMYKSIDIKYLYKID